MLSLSLSLFSLFLFFSFRSDCIELDFKEISYLVYYAFTKKNTKLISYFFQRLLWFPPKNKRINLGFMEKFRIAFFTAGMLFWIKIKVLSKNNVCFYFTYIVGHIVYVNSICTLFSDHTCLDFDYVRPCLVLLQFNFTFISRGFCNLNLKIKKYVC